MNFDQIHSMDDESKKIFLEKNGKGNLFNSLKKTATRLSLKEQLIYTDNNTGRTLSFVDELNRAFPIICLIFFERRVRSKSDGIVVRYKEFRRCKEHAPEIFKQFFTPSMYGKLFKDCCGFISPTKFINCCLKVLYTMQIRSELGIINPLDEIITYYDFYYWIKSVINECSNTKLGIVRQLSENNSTHFENFYITYVVERILFLNGNKNNILKISDIVSSEQFSKFLELRIMDNIESENPFNPQTIYQLFEWFCFRTKTLTDNYLGENNVGDSINDSQSIDISNIRPEDMVFLPETLQQLMIDFEYVIPKLVISRIFEIHSKKYKFLSDQQFRGAIDLKCVLKVMFSLEFKDSKSAINWFWEILDIHENGYIDLDVINCFWKEMVICIGQLYSIDSLPKFEYISDEIFDMISPGNTNGRIDKQNFSESPMAPTVISYLCDPKAFIAIELREEMIAQAASKNRENNFDNQLETCELNENNSIKFN
ncbi:phosphatase subunit protein [Cryptosporidium ryanae]|uniref:phosphatase subunit protein n=1 Tax=Cryptosporidium ryanae TaxID=515981 RepID=UPI00351A9D7B|nr:phosphatase subunit protein [Cryptosporidium ryanae]